MASAPPSSGAHVRQARPAQAPGCQSACDQRNGCRHARAAVQRYLSGYLRPRPTPFASRWATGCSCSERTAASQWRRCDRRFSTAPRSRCRVAAAPDGACRARRPYRYTGRFCAWGAETASSAGRLVPLNRHLVVSWLEVEARWRLYRKAPKRRGRGGAAASVRARRVAVADAEGSESSSGDSADDLADVGDMDLDAGPARKWCRTAVTDAREGATATGRRGVVSMARQGRGSAGAGPCRGRNATAGRGSRGAAEARQGGRDVAAAGRGQRGRCATGRGGQGRDAVG